MSESNRSESDSQPASDKEQDTKGAGVKFPPPLVFILLMLVGYALHQVWPVRVAEHGLIIAGSLLVILGFATVMIANQTFKRAQTNIEPWKPTSAIVSNGIFGYSRNPIYVAFCLVTLGVGLLINSLLVMLSFIPAIAIVYHIAIKKEEHYLEEKFGDEYRQYKASVRRWL